MPLNNGWKPIVQIGNGILIGMRICTAHGLIGPGGKMTAFDWLWELNLACCGFFSTEKSKQKASNSELRRWFDKGSVIINGENCKATDLFLTIRELILFPKSNRRRTSFYFSESERHV
jgi:hypothetical protein